MTPFHYDIDPRDIDSLPDEQKIEAFFRRTCALSDFAEKHVCRVLVTQLQKSMYEQALAATYYRMCLLLRGLAKLEDPCHFQAAAMAARLLFELLLDLKALAGNPALTQKFFDFTRASRFYKAKHLERFLQEHPNLSPTPHKAALALVNKPSVSQSRQQLCIQHGWLDSKGNPRCPDHWSRKSIADRAQDAGVEYEEIYRSQFFIQSYYVHAGGAGIDSMSREALACVFGTAHALVQRLFAEATEIIGEKFHLFTADSQLRGKLKAAADSSGLYSLQESLRRREVESECTEEVGWASPTD